jgi:hypothetical protein
MLPIADIVPRFPPAIWQCSWTWRSSSRSSKAPRPRRGDHIRAVLPDRKWQVARKEPSTTRARLSDPSTARSMLAAAHHGSPGPPTARPGRGGVAESSAAPDDRDGQTHHHDRGDDRGGHGRGDQQGIPVVVAQQRRPRPQRHDQGGDSDPRVGAAQRAEERHPPGRVESRWPCGRPLRSRCSRRPRRWWPR